MFSLVIIAFIFGIHTDIFSSYDRYNSNNKTQYNWFNPNDIFKFPIEQYGINAKNKFPTDTIDLSNPKKIKIKKRKVTIVLDKTGSLFFKKDSKNYKTSLEVSLKRKLKNKLHELNLKNTKIEDLFLLTAIEKLSKDSIIKTHIEVLIYTGSEQFNPNNIYHKPSFDGILNKKTLNTVFNKVLKDIQKLNSQKQQQIINTRCTDFHGLIKLLNEEKFTGRDEEKFNHKKLIFLSDFKHEEYNSNKTFQEVSTQLEKLNNNINQINLIIFESSTRENTIAAKKIQSLFKKTFNNLFFYEFRAQLKNDIPNEDEISLMFSSVTDDDQYVTLYNSFQNQTYKSDYKGSVFIKGFDKDFIFGFGNRLKPSSYIKGYNYLTIKNDNDSPKKLYPFVKKSIEKSEKAYTLSFITDEKESKNLYMEFNFPNTSTHIIRQPITFKSVLPTTSCLYLILFYYITISSFFILILYYAKAIWLSENSKTGKFKFFYSLTCVGLVGILIFMFYVLIPNSYKLLSYLEAKQIFIATTLMILFIVFKIILFYSSLTKHKKVVKNEKKV